MFCNFCKYPTFSAVSTSSLSTQYDTFGHCYITEDGFEVDNTFKNNLGAKTKSQKIGIGASDRTASTYWVTNPMNHLWVFFLSALFVACCCFSLDGPIYWSSHTEYLSFLSLLHEKVLIMLPQEPNFLDFVSFPPCTAFSVLKPHVCSHILTLCAFSSYSLPLHKKQGLKLEVLEWNLLSTRSEATLPTAMVDSGYSCIPVASKLRRIFERMLHHYSFCSAPKMKLIWLNFPVFSPCSNVFPRCYKQCCSGLIVCPRRMPTLITARCTRTEWPASNLNVLPIS